MQRRTKDFAHRCVRLAVSLQNDHLCNHVRNQLIRCSTSVAANYRAACLAKSKTDFESKIGTVLEESDESGFWLEFLLEEKVVTAK